MDVALARADDSEYDVIRGNKRFQTEDVNIAEKQLNGVDSGELMILLKIGV